MKRKKKLWKIQELAGVGVWSDLKSVLDDDRVVDCFYEIKAEALRDMKNLLRSYKAKCRVVPSNTRCDFDQY
jgi:hypothetical protein